MKKKYNCGIVLSGGAARGYGHIGVLKSLEEHNLIPDKISGVSAGALVGAFYAHGYKPTQILDIFHDGNLRSFSGFDFTQGGLLTMDPLKGFLDKHLKIKYLQDLPKPLVVAITNYQTGDIEYFSKGELIPILIASSCIPVLFKPFKIDGTLYIDGGVIDNFPSTPIYKSCKKIIGVHVNPIGNSDGVDNLKHVAIRAFQLTLAAAVKEKLDQIDVFIEPQGLKDFGLLDFSKGQEMFEIAYHYTNQYLSKN